MIRFKKIEIEKAPGLLVKESGGSLTIGKLSLYVLLWSSVLVFFVVHAQLGIQLY